MTTLNAILDDSNELYRLFVELEERTESMTDIEKAEEFAILADWLGDTKELFERKVDGYVAVIRQMRANAQAAKDEAKRLQDRAKSFEGKSESLKDMLVYAMNRLGMDKCKTPMNTVSISTNGGKAPMDINENLVPDEYMKMSVDRTKVYQALNDGKDVEGAKLLERGKSLRIR